MYYCNREHFDPDRSFLSATQNFRFSFFLQISRAGQKKYRAAAVSYIYNWNLMDYKHRFRFFCCPHCVRLTLCPFVRPLLCGTDCYKHGSLLRLRRTRIHSCFSALHRHLHLLLLLLLLLIPTSGGLLCIHIYIMYVYGNTFFFFFLETGALLCCKRLRRGRCKPRAHTFKRRFSERR